MGPTFSGLPVRTLTGKIKIHPVGYGFVVPDDKSEDVHVSARNRGTAMDGDTIEIEAWPGVRGVEGRVTRVLSRGRAKITGQLVRRGKHQVLQPDDPRITGLVSLSGSIPEARDGIAVVAEITRYPDVADGPIEAKVLKVLGDPDDPRTEVEKVLACADVEEEFPDEVERIAAAFGDTITLSDRVDRADLREVPFTTIDPETARDFDDAVALEKLPNGGSRLWVAVADVSHYVREGSPLNEEALRRGCSIYLPSRAIPMLPEPLSARLCSLVPEEDRLAMVVRIDLDRQANVVDRDFMAAVIHSKARLDYPGVAAALGGDTRGKRKKYEAFLPALRAMDSLARQLRVARLARGALDFDLPEPFVELDRDDPRLVRAIRKSRRDPGERQAYSMIEEFMLAANEAVAGSFQERGDDTLWRIHDAPDRARLEEFAALAENYGIPVDLDETRTPKGLKRVLDKLKGHSAEKALSFQLLRSLKQATYDVVNIGHFGLASADYLHFTSPIRRYPDSDRPPAPQVAPGRPRQAGWRLQAAQRRPGSRSGRAAEDGRRVVVLRAAGDGGRARGGRSLPGLLHARPGGGRARRGHLRRHRVWPVRDHRRSVRRGVGPDRRHLGRLLHLRRAGLSPRRASLGAGVRAGRQRAGRGPVGQRRAAKDRLRARRPRLAAPRPRLPARRQTAPRRPVSETWGGPEGVGEGWGPAPRRISPGQTRGRRGCAADRSLQIGGARQPAAR